MTTTLRRLIRNEREYPWSRSPLEQAAWWARPRVRLGHLAQANASLYAALAYIAYPYSYIHTGRRELVKSHVETARTYLRMAVEP